MSKDKWVKWETVGEEEIGMTLTGEPFASLMSAKGRAAQLRKNARIFTEPVEVEGGYGLQRIKPTKKQVRLAERKKLRAEARQILTIPDEQKDPAYRYRFVNDRDDLNRHYRMKRLGWEVVVDKDVEVGDDRAGRAGRIGSAVAVPVGGGTTGVLMRIPKEIFEEDKAQAEDERLAVEEQMTNASEQDGHYGKISMNR